MKTLKNTSRFPALLLSLAMLFVMTSCGGKTGETPSGSTLSDAANTDTSQADAPDEPKQEEPSVPEKPAEFTLETAEARLLYMEDSYMAVALLNCPATNYGMTICDKAGNDLGVYMLDRYRGITLKNGVWLADAEKWPSEYGADDIGALVVDSTHEQADGSNAAKL